MISLSTVRAGSHTRPEGFVAFAAATLVAQAMLGWPVGTLASPLWALLATLLFGASAVAAARYVRTGDDSWLAAAPVFGFILVVVLWRHAAGGVGSGFTPMLGIAVLWLALHGRLTQVWVAVAVVISALVTPILLIGAPEYPASNLRGVLLWALLLSLLGPMTHRVVRQREESRRRTREAMASLRSQEQLYRRLIDSLPSTSVGLIDEQLRWVTISGQYLRDSGLQAEDIIGRPAGAHADAALAGQVQTLFRQAFQEPVSTIVRGPSGNWVELDALPVDDDETHPTQVLVVARDVTDRHRADLERERLLDSITVSEERFRALFDDAPTGIALATASEAGPGQLLRANAALAAMLGRDAADLVGMSVADLTHPDDRGLNPRSLREGSRDSLQVRYLHSSGRPIWVEIHYVTLTDAETDRPYLLMQVVDITTRKASERALLDALEQQRAAAEALREADAVRTEVMSTVSHELRTPLTSILGYVEMLADDDLADSQVAMLEVVHRNAERLHALVEDLLLLTRLEDPFGRITRQTSVSVDEVVAAAVTTMRPVVKRRRQRLVVEGHDGDPHAYVDAEHLDRALMNLLSNASKYTPEGGEIRVSVVVAGEYVDLAVADDGYGISSTEMSRLFTRFYRAASASESGSPGTGLGLAIVKSLVELNGGRVSVRSTPAMGSTFTLSLPRDKHSGANLHRAEELAGRPRRTS